MSVSTPRPIEFFRGHEINLVAAGHSHSGVVTSQRDFYVFGACEYQPTEAQERMSKKKKKIDLEARPSVYSMDVSQLKDMKPSQTYTGLVPAHEPRVVSFLEPGRCKVDVVFLGTEMTLAVIEGLVFGWGSGFCRLLAFADPNHSLSSSSVHLLYANKSDPCIDLSSSDTHIVLITETGKALSCGSAKLGALGTGNSHQDVAEPELIQTGHPARQVACCKGSTYFFVTPPLTRIPLDQIMQFEQSKIPFMAEFLIEVLQQERTHLIHSFMSGMNFHISVGWEQLTAAWRESFVRLVLPL